MAAAAPIVAGAAVGMMDSKPSIGEREAASPHAPGSFEIERVREFEPPAALVTESVPSGPGFAVAAPVKIEWPADLQQVESDPEKVSTAQQEMDREPLVPRPKRVRHALDPVSEEPLVQIETSDADVATGGAEEKTPAVPG